MNKSLIIISVLAAMCTASAEIRSVRPTSAGFGIYTSLSHGTFTISIGQPATKVIRKGHVRTVLSCDDDGDDDIEQAKFVPPPTINGS